MENAADALKMAAAVLVFVMALGIGISSFSQARETADLLIQYADRDSVTQYVQDTGNTTRSVGEESIIPTIYRAYKENYRIVFYDTDGNPLPLFTQNDDSGNPVEINYIDLEKETIAENRQKDNFIMALLYGNQCDLQDNLLLDANGNKISFSDFVTQIEVNNDGITLDNRRNL